MVPRNSVLWRQRSVIIIMLLDPADSRSSEHIIDFIIKFGNENSSDDDRSEMDNEFFLQFIGTREKTVKYRNRLCFGVDFDTLNHLYNLII